MKHKINEAYTNSAERIALSDMPKEGIDRFRKKLYLPKKHCQSLIALGSVILATIVIAAIVYRNLTFSGNELVYVSTVLLVISLTAMFVWSAKEQVKDRKVIVTIYEHPSSKTGLMRVTEPTNEVIFYGKERRIHSKGDTVWVGHKAIMLADGITNQEYDDVAIAAEKVDMYFYQSDDDQTLHLVHAAPAAQEEEPHEKEKDKA